MPTQADFDAAIDTLMQTISDATDRVAKDIADLKAQLAAGTPITQADLDRLAQVNQKVADIDPPTP